MTRRFEAFIQKVREDIPVCPECRNGTQSCFVCPDCEMVHCWYCEADLIAVPKSILKQAARKREAFHEKHQTDGAEEFAVSLIAGIREALEGKTLEMAREMPGPEIIAGWIEYYLDEINHTCPHCKQKLDNVGFCENGHAHCLKCDEELCDLPTPIRIMVEAHQDKAESRDMMPHRSSYVQ